MFHKVHKKKNTNHLKKKMFLNKLLIYLLKIGRVHKHYTSYITHQIRTDLWADITK